MQDLRLAFRALRATPIVTAVAVLSLALGIGANTVIFSLVDSVLLRALPVADPGRLTLLTRGGTRAVGGSQSWTYPIWNEVRRRPHLFEGACAWYWNRFNLSSGGPTDFANGIWASGGFFELLGVPAILGRTFTEVDDRRGGGSDGPVAVVSYSFWQRRFSGATDTIGRTLALDGVPFTIVGVTPAGFFGPEVGLAFDVVVPLETEPLVRAADSILDRRDRYALAVMIRLKAKQSSADGAEALRGVQPQIREATMPAGLRQRDMDGHLKEPFSLTSAAGGQSALRLRYQRPLLTIMVAVSFVLLIACANIANLLLARASARRYELSVRLVLGASRWDLRRQLLTEAVLLAGIGAMCALVIASWGSHLLVRMLSTPTNLVFLELPLDWRVLGFTAGLAVATALLFGTAPAFRGSGIEPMEVLKEHGRGLLGDGRVPLVSGLIVGQVSLSVVLVVAAVLFVRTFASLATLHLGFERDRVLVVNVSAQRTAVDPLQRLPLYERIREVVAAAPGVADAAVSLVTPVSGVSITPTIEVPGGATLPERERSSFVNFISPRWFATFGTPLMVGRDFTDRDRNGTQPVVIVNQAFARKFLHGVNPLGHAIMTTSGPTARSMEIVGGVGDAVYRSLRDPLPPTWYVPLAQFNGPPFLITIVSLSVRSNSTPILLTKSVTAALQDVNPRLALTFLPLADQVNASLAQERLLAMLAGFFGGLGLLLAGIGLYGVTSYAVSRRRKEIGIRMALGAVPRHVVRLVLSRVLVLVGIGVVIGWTVSVWASRFVESLLYGVKPSDPETLVGAALVLAIAASVAACFPAWRASRIDPAEVLRES